MHPFLVVKGGAVIPPLAAAAAADFPVGACLLAGWVAASWPRRGVEVGPGLGSRHSRPHEEYK